MQTTASRPLRSALPNELTSFVGRRQEVADVRQHLVSSRLVTLVGPGGVGKTRVAVRVAGSLRRTFPDGVWFVDLAGLDDGDLIADELVSALDAPHQPGLTQAEVLVHDLAGRDALLILDTCERVLDSCAELVSQLLETSGRLRILATSRQALQLAAEQVYVISPFRLGSGARPGASDDVESAVQLFADRAKSVVPDFDVSSGNLTQIGEVCRRLDGLPLAIELAALQVPIFTVRDLVDRLDNHSGLVGAAPRSSPARQTSLEATLGWSFELCTPLEQLLWSRCSVFAGGFDLAAAEDVCADERLPREAIAATLFGLVGKSILLRERIGDAVRFRLLDSVRAYGSQRLPADDGDLAIRDAHARWIGALVRAARDAWFGPDQAAWLEKIEAERGNVRAALEHLLSGADAEAALEPAAALGFYWLSAGHLDEGTMWVERALAASTQPSIDRNRALWTAALFALLHRDVEAAHRYAELCVAEADTLDDVAAQANAHHVLGLASFSRGDIEGAERWARIAVEEFARSELADERATMSKVQLGVTLAVAGRAAEADDVLRESADECALVGDVWVSAYALQAGAVVAYVEGDIATSKRRAASGLAGGRQLRDYRALTPRLDLLGWVAAAEGAYERAATLLGAARATWSREHSPSYRWTQINEMRERAAEGTRTELGDEAFAAAYERGAAMDFDQAVRFALDEPLVPAPRTTAPTHGLTARELEIARLVGDGLSNRDIARTLVLSPRTVENHVQRVLVKLDFRSRTQIAAWIARGDLT